MTENVWVGLDVGGTKTAIVISAEPPAVLGRTVFATLPAKGADRALELAKEGIRELLAQRGLEASAIKRIGASCGGPLDRIAGIIQSPPNLPTWDNVPIKAIMEKEFGVECQVENRPPTLERSRSPIWCGSGSAKYGLPDHGHRARRGHHHGRPPLSRHE